MSILIKGMDLPSGCGRCPCSSYGDCDAKQRKRLTGEFRYSPDKRPDWCPMIEISPHGRLIDADAAIRQGWTISRNYSASPTESVYEIKTLDALPTIIEAEGEND